MKSKILILLLGVLIVFGSFIYLNHDYKQVNDNVDNCQEDINSLVFQKQFTYDDMSDEEKRGFNLNAYSVIKRCDNLNHASE